MQSAFMANPISTFFGFCIWVLQVIGDFTGMGYELANIVIFVIVHPALTLALFVLWRRAQRQAVGCSCTLCLRPTAKQNKKSIVNLLMQHGWTSRP